MGKYSYTILLNNRLTGISGYSLHNLPIRDHGDLQPMAARNTEYIMFAECLWGLLNYGEREFSHPSTLTACICVNCSNSRLLFLADMSRPHSASSSLVQLCRHNSAWHAYVTWFAPHWSASRLYNICFLSNVLFKVNKISFLEHIQVPWVPWMIHITNFS